MALGFFCLFVSCFVFFKFNFMRALECSVIDLWLGNAALQWQLTRITFFSPLDELVKGN